MKILADESVDKAIILSLRKEGHSVIYVAEQFPGIADQQVLDLSNNEERLLLTADKDFGELVFRQNLASRGIFLIRLSGMPSWQKCDIVSNALRQHHDRLWNSFTVITSNSIRIRPRL